jgi:hypothetical protein
LLSYWNRPRNIIVIANGGGVNIEQNWNDNSNATFQKYIEVNLQFYLMEIKAVAK